MSARSELLLPGEWNNPLPPLFATPLRERNIRPLEVSKINVRRNCASNNAFWSVVIDDMKDAIAPLNIERRRNVYFSVQVPPHGLTPSHWLLYPEQLWIGPRAFDSRKLLISLIVSFLSTVPFWRQAEVTNPTQLTGAIPTNPPANDNDDWREAA